MADAMCPPHHWQVTFMQLEGVPFQHHQCIRCGAQKDAPAPESPSMFWDRVDPPERRARIGRRG
jgi:hypothetical protein